MFHVSKSFQDTIQGSDVNDRKRQEKGGDSVPKYLTLTKPLAHANHCTVPGAHRDSVGPEANPV